jgi:hypothetical protein
MHQYEKEIITEYIELKSTIREICRKYKTSHFKVKEIFKDNNITLRPSCPDISGTIIGKWKILEKDIDRSKKEKCTFWRCECECGNIKSVSNSTFQKKESFICKECFDKKDVVNNIMGTTFNNIKANAFYRKNEFNISKEYIDYLYETQNRRCAISNLEISLRSRYLDKQTASLDRIDSKQGYIEGNVEWLHKDVNIMKWDLNKQVFLEWVGLIDNYQNGIINNDINEIIIYKNHGLKKYPGNIYSFTWHSILNGAKEKKFEINITPEYIWGLYLRQNGLCNLTGQKIVFSDSYRNYKIQSASLDRINSKKGYIIGNVQWVHKTVNKMKLDFSLDRFLYLCNTINDYQIQKGII